MVFVVVALCLLTTLVVIDLLMSFGIIRRLRAHSEMIYDRDGAASLPAGTPVPDFVSLNAKGESMSAAWLRGATSAVAFVTQDCPSCHAQLPALLDMLKQRGADGDRSLVIVVDVPGGQDITELAAMFDGLATVVIEPLGGILQTAFRINGLPAFVAVDPEAIVMSSSSAVNGLLASSLAGS